MTQRRAVAPGARYQLLLAHPVARFAATATPVLPAHRLAADDTEQAPLSIFERWHDLINQVIGNRSERSEGGERPFRLSIHHRAVSAMVTIPAARLPSEARVAQTQCGGDRGWPVPRNRL